MDKKKRVVIVDDEKEFTALVKEALEGTGKYEVTEANEGFEGLGVIKKCCPNLVLLDLMLPGIDGSNVAVQLKELEATKNIPVVFLTAAVTLEEIEAQMGSIGGHIFLAKPVGIRELIECVDENAR
ncbi:MAG: response regulator [Candidatus Omnitrophota bacterium]